MTVTAQWQIGDAPYPGARGTTGPKYKVGPLCAMPLCQRPADHAHHLWGRGYMGGSYDYIVVHEETVPNLIGLCWQHHEDVTGSVGGYRAGIKYELDGTLWWHGKNGDRLEMAWGGPDEFTEDGHVLCPECGRKKPLPRDESLPKAPKRPKARVVLTVPQDALENGAVILEGLFSQVKEKLGREESEPTYYSLCDALYDWLTSEPVAAGG
jgi:hypothetical protein